jgi:cell division septum initiation protein DivIVA
VKDIIRNEIIALDIDKINFDDKESLRALILQMFNTIEQLAQANQDLRTENQELKDEIK